MNLALSGICSYPGGPSWPSRPSALAGGADDAAEPGHADDHPELVGLVTPQREFDVGLPQVELGQLAGAILGALAGVGRDEQRAQLRHPVA